MTTDFPSFLKQPVSVLPLVGPKSAKKLERLAIFTLSDLLYYYPFRYDDLSQKTSVIDLKSNEIVTLTGQIINLTNTYLRSGKTIQKGLFSDDTGTIGVTWFNQPFLVKTLSQYPGVSLSGKVTLYHGSLTLISPQYEPHQTSLIHTGRLVPVYHETSSISSKWLRRQIFNLLSSVSEIPDWLPPDSLSDHQLLPLSTALRQIHFPDNWQSFQAAYKRLEFEEMLILQLKALLRRQKLQSQLGNKFSISSNDKTVFLKSLPFTLTPSQDQALLAIEADVVSGRPMNRLLQGDVGSGKTVVAAYALYLSVLNGYHAAMMAPTEILIKQHFETLSPIFGKLQIPILIHTGSSPRTSPTTSPQIHLGTHALLYRHLSQSLGLVVIDEQHKFGVDQRDHLIKQTPVPHLLSLSATPIPRTLCLTFYADLDVTPLTDSPFQKHIKTRVVPESKRNLAYDFIKKQIKEHQSQVYYVCPFIEDSLNPQLETIKSAKSTYTNLKTQIFPNLRIGLLHGRLKPTEKSKVMREFQFKQLDLLVATSLVEVGLDIPNASIMIIESGERFGLASLHQLRGRIGRQGQSGYCLIFINQNATPSSLDRLKHLETFSAGLELAEADLKTRGPGDIYGTKQSGFIELKLASLTNMPLIQLTHKVAGQLLPQAKNNLPLSQKLETLLEY